jgi:hypothetical protein
MVGLPATGSASVGNADFAPDRLDPQTQEAPRS